MSIAHAMNKMAQALRASTYVHVRNAYALHRIKLPEHSGNFLAKMLITSRFVPAKCEKQVDGNTVADYRENYKTRCRETGI